MVSSVAWYTTLIALVGLERLGELILARRNAKLAFAAGGREIGHGHFRVMSVMHTLFLFSCIGEVFVFHRAFPGTLGWLALAGACGAQALRYWAIATLGNRWNVRIIVVPTLDPIVGGPYRWIRHPNYVAVILEMFCLPLIHGAWLTAIVFSLCNMAVLAVRIRAEELALGAHYQAAFARTPRFVPK